MDKVTSFPEDETVEDQIAFYMELLARRSSSYSGAKPDEMQYRAFAVFWARLQDEGLVNNHRDFFTAVAALCHCIHRPKTGAMAHFYGYLLRIAFLEDGEPNVDKTEQAFEYLREALDDFCPWYSRDVQPARRSESQTLSAVS